MSLLEVITKASAKRNQWPSESKYPIVFNPEPILNELKLQIEDSDDAPSLIKRVDGWKISETESEVIELEQNFSEFLKQKLKKINDFNKNDFVVMLTIYLGRVSDELGVSVGVDMSDVGYTNKWIGKLGFLMGEEVLSLVLEACIVLEHWELIETLIVHGHIKHSCSSNLVRNLIEKQRSDLICVSVMYIKDLQSSDVVAVLKYFLLPSKEAYSTMVNLRKEWENDALSAIKAAADDGVRGKVLNLAREASILLMLAYDGFSASQLCLHYLLALEDLDEVILPSCISKLNGSEMMALIRYLGKWLRKYEKFPQAYPCPKASSVLGFKACSWVPPLANIVKWFGLVIDENFSSLVLRSEFHEELRSLEGVADSLSSEARLCSTVARLAETLKPDVKGWEAREGLGNCS